MKIPHKYRVMALGAGWSFLFAFIGVATVISAHCLSSHDNCKGEALGGLWGDAVVGLLVMLTATAAEAKLPHLCPSTDNPTNGKSGSEGDS